MDTEPVKYITKIRSKNMEDFERYINAIGIDYDSEDVAFIGYVFRLNIPQFKVVRRGAHTESNNYMKKIVENKGRNYYIPFSQDVFYQLY